MAHPEMQAAGPFPAGWTSDLESFFGPLSELFSAGGGWLARSYMLGLLLPGERKSVQPIAKRLGVEYESLQHFVNDSPWNDSELLRPLRASLARRTERIPVDERALVVDDTGFLKKGDCSPGVQRQYTGSAGKTVNCQVATCLVYAWWPAGAVGPAFACPVDWRLYLPASWLEPAARERREKARIPDDTPFRTKLQIAIEQIDLARADGLDARLVLADAAYGDSSAFRAALRERGYAYSAGITPAHQRVVVEGTSAIVTPESIAATLPSDSWQYVRWREARRHELGANFVRLAVRLVLDGKPTDEEAELLLERRLDGELKAHLLHGLAHLPLAVAAERARRRWVCEQVYQQAKDELGVDHFEGRSLRGWYHHTSLETVVHAFLALERWQLWHARNVRPAGPIPPPSKACPPSDAPRTRKS